MMEEYLESNVEKSAGRWTHEEHVLFLQGLELYQKQWKLIADLVKTRTVVQIRTHAQKFFQKIDKAAWAGSKPPNGKPEKNEDAMMMMMKPKDPLTRYDGIHTAVVSSSESSVTEGGTSGSCKSSDDGLEVGYGSYPRSVAVQQSNEQFSSDFLSGFKDPAYLNSSIIPKQKVMKEIRRKKRSRKSDQSGAEPQAKKQAFGLEHFAPPHFLPDNIFDGGDFGQSGDPLLRSYDEDDNDGLDTNILKFIGKLDWTTNEFESSRNDCDTSGELDDDLSFEVLERQFGDYLPNQPVVWNNCGEPYKASVSGKVLPHVVSDDSVAGTHASLTPATFSANSKNTDASSISDSHDGLLQLERTAKPTQATDSSTDGKRASPVMKPKSRRAARISSRKPDQSFAAIVDFSSASFQLSTLPRLPYIKELTATCQYHFHKSESEEQLEIGKSNNLSKASKDFDLEKFMKEDCTLLSGNSSMSHVINGKPILPSLQCADKLLSGEMSSSLTSNVPLVAPMNADSVIRTKSENSPHQFLSETASAMGNIIENGINIVSPTMPRKRGRPRKQSGEYKSGAEMRAGLSLGLPGDASDIDYFEEYTKSPQQEFSFQFTSEQSAAHFSHSLDNYGDSANQNKNNKPELENHDSECHAYVFDKDISDEVNAMLTDMDENEMMQCKEFTVSNEIQMKLTGDDGLRWDDHLDGTMLEAFE